MMASSDTEWSALDPPPQPHHDVHSTSEQKMDAEPGDVGTRDSVVDLPGEDSTESSKRSRGHWSSKLEFTLSTLGDAVGLGNVWRFPYLSYKNGGGAFFVPYFIMLFTLGIPMYFLESTLGQFTSQGAVKCWQYAPIFQGVGAAMAMVSCMIAIYYNMIVAWILYYLFASFTDYLPWTECADPWQSATCGITVNGSKASFPAKDYFDNEIRGRSGTSLENFGELKWELLLCLLLAWIITALCLCKGIQSAGKVAYVTTLLPYPCLATLLINGLAQDGNGAMEGIKFYITPSISRLGDSSVWLDAAVQIFFSVSLSMGGITTMASYNDIHLNIFTTTLLVPIVNCLTSVFAGFAVFSYIGILAENANLPVDEVVDSGPSLAFVIYPTAVTYLPYPPFWSIVFFLMMLSLGVNSEYVLVESVMTGIKDCFPRARRHTFPIVVAVCLILFILGIPYCFEGGIDLLNIMDNFASGWNSLIIALMTSLSLSHIYGIDRYLDDATFMLGDRCTVCCIPWRYWRIVCKIFCGFLTPAMLLFLLFYTWIEYKSPLENMPLWADGLGWAITSVSVFSIFGTMAVMMVMAKGSFINRLHTLATPTDKWGPYDKENKSEWSKLKENTGPSLSRWLQRRIRPVPSTDGGEHFEQVEEVTTQEAAEERGSHESERVTQS